MYLVVLRHTMDDLPVRLCKTREEAELAASRLAWEPNAAERNVFHTDCSTPTSIAIVAYDGHGLPRTMDVVRTFDEETATA